MHGKVKSAKGIVCKGWCFTYNNPGMSSMAFLALMSDKWKALEYCVFQLEQGKKGTQHFQGYAEFNKKMRKTQLLKLDPVKMVTTKEGKKILSNTIWWSGRRGTRTEARDYCMKDDETKFEEPLEFGYWIPGDNHPNKFALIAQQIRQGKSEEKIAEEFPEEYVKFNRGLNKLICIQVRISSRCH